MKVIDLHVKQLVSYMLFWIEQGQQIVSLCHKNV